MIARIVGRCHVGESFHAVARYLVSRMNRDAWRKLPRATKREVLASALRAHRENGDLYHAVMTGRVSQ
jgi:hypothetical protein